LSPSGHDLSACTRACHRWHPRPGQSGHLMQCIAHPCRLHLRLPNVRRSRWQCDRLAYIPAVGWYLRARHVQCRLLMMMPVEESRSCYLHLQVRQENRKDSKRTHRWIGSHESDVTHFVWPFRAFPIALPVLGSQSLTCLCE
jgi:hypothetical protein